VILLAIVLIAAPLLPIPFLAVRFNVLPVRADVASKIDPLLAIKLRTPAVLPPLIVPASISPLLAVRLMGSPLLSVLDTTSVAVIVPAALTVIGPLAVVRLVNVKALLLLRCASPAAVTAPVILLAIVLIAVPLLPIPFLAVRFNVLPVRADVASRIEPLLAVKLRIPAVLPPLIVPASMSPLLAVKLIGLALLSVLDTTSVAVIVPLALTLIEPLAVDKFVSVTAPV